MQKCAAWGNEPKKTGTIRLPFLFNPQGGLHVRDNRVAKL